MHIPFHEYMYKEWSHSIVILRRGVCELNLDFFGKPRQQTWMNLITAVCLFLLGLLNLILLQIEDFTTNISCF